MIAGTPDGVAAAGAAAREAGVKRVVPLNVGGAFHTPLMAPAAQAFAPHLAATTFLDTPVAVVANTDAAPHTDGAGWPARLTEHLTVPVRWTATMQTFERLGVDTLVEVGPGSTLVNLAKRALPGVRLITIATPDDVRSLQEES